MSFSQLLEDLFEDRSSYIKQGCIGKIDKFDAELMRADVELLGKSVNDLDEEVDLPLLPDIPVSFINAGGFMIRPEYQKGDLVWIVFATHDIEDMLDEQKKALSKKKNGLENACVIGGVAKTNWIAPTLFKQKKGLLICEKDGEMYVHFDKSKITAKCSIEWDGDFELKRLTGGTITMNDTEISMKNKTGFKVIIESSGIKLETLTNSLEIPA